MSRLRRRHGEAEQIAEESKRDGAERREDSKCQRHKERVHERRVSRQPSSGAEWKRFVLRHRAQIAEVLTKYGEILELSLDMQFPHSFDQDMIDTVMLARTLAPNTLFRAFVPFPIARC